MSQLNNRLSQIIDEIKRLDESLSYNNDKLYTIIKKNFDEGKTVFINENYIHKSLYKTAFNEITFHNNQQFVYIKITDIITIHIKED